MGRGPEDPTPRRLELARRRGDVPTSSTLLGAAAFTTFVLVAPHQVGWMARTCRNLLLAGLGDPSVARELVAGLPGLILHLAVPWTFACAVTAAAVGFVQSGGLFAPRVALPDGARVRADLRRLWSSRRAVLSSLGLIVFATVAVIWGRLSISSLGRCVGSVECTTNGAHAALQGLVWGTLAVLWVLGLLDVRLAVLQWKSRFRMTRADELREQRATEGDERWRERRASAHREALEGSLTTAVESAALVLLGHQALAVALAYDGSSDAPRVAAAGRGALGERIRSVAGTASVPMVQDVALAEQLALLNAGERIPRPLYGAVARWLAEVLQGPAPN